MGTENTRGMGKREKEMEKYLTEGKKINCRKETL